MGFGTSALLTELTPALPPGDTWTWDGVNWTQLHPATSPPARRGASFAWDSKRARLILYGGRGRPNEGLYDTWAWNGSEWAPLAANSTDFGAATGDIAYDPVADQLVLYHWAGGAISDPSQRFMWIFDGSTWTKRSTGTAQMPISGPLAYDEQIAKVILFGQRPDPGNHFGESGATTWVYDGRAWAQASDASGPPDRFYPLAVYDTARKRVILFGGYRLANNTPLQQNDLWEFDGRIWSLVG